MWVDPPWIASLSCNYKFAFGVEPTSQMDACSLRRIVARLKKTPIDHML
jgi:hypothetical protein